MLTHVSATSADRELRLKVVAAFPDFLRRCTHGHEVVEAVAATYSVPSYLVGLMNTAYLSAEQWPITEATLRKANPRSERSRFGPEHWSLLVDKGFAQQEQLGWRLTPAGTAVVIELHHRLRAEISRRTIAGEGVAAVRSEFARIAHALPRLHRVDVIRQLWAGEQNEITQLYRVVWELYIQGRALMEDVFFTDWPTGEKLRALEEGFAELAAGLG